MKNKIEWTDRTWNPITGCTPISEGCEHCYAKRIYERFNKEDFSKITFHAYRLNQPFFWKKPLKIFVGSMTDIFHENIAGVFRDRVFEAIEQNPQHVFQILTKRPENIKTLFQNKQERHFSNVWIGVTVENQKRAEERIPLLWESGKVSFEKYFVSIEPMLSMIDLGKLKLEYMPDWVIVGKENGAGARPFDKAWALGIYEQCKKHNIPFFWKDKTVSEPEYKQYPAGAIESEEAKWLNK